MIFEPRLLRTLLKITEQPVAVSKVSGVWHGKEERALPKPVPSHGDSGMHKAAPLRGISESEDCEREIDFAEIIQSVTKLMQQHAPEGQGSPKLL